MKVTFEIEMANMPSDLTVAEKMAWEYYFNYCEYVAVKTETEFWIVTTSNCDLREAFIFPDTEDFLEWLINSFREDFKLSPIDVIRAFVKEPAPITDAMVDIFRTCIMEDDAEK